MVQGVLSDWCQYLSRLFIHFSNSLFRFDWLKAMLVISIYMTVMFHHHSSLSYWILPYKGISCWSLTCTNWNCTVVLLFWHRFGGKPILRALSLAFLLCIRVSLFPSKLKKQYNYPMVWLDFYFEPIMCQICSGNVGRVMHRINHVKIVHSCRVSGSSSKVTLVYALIWVQEALLLT